MPSFTYTSAETIPDDTTVLYCFNNQLTTLPTLPFSLKVLWCGNNQLPTWYNLSPNEIRQEQQRRNKAALVIQKTWRRYWYTPNKEGISLLCQKSCQELNSAIYV